MNQNFNLKVFQINKLRGWVHYWMDDVETGKNLIKTATIIKYRFTYLTYFGSNRIPRSFEVVLKKSKIRLGVDKVKPKQGMV